MTQIRFLDPTSCCLNMLGAGRIRIRPPIIYMSPLPQFTRHRFVPIDTPVDILLCRSNGVSRDDPFEGMRNSSTPKYLRILSEVVSALPY
jgi:hypothetical protein